MATELNGRTIVITGGSTGIGAAAARHFRRKGARVVITGRSAETERLARQIGADHYLADFARFPGVEDLARALLGSYPRIDVLVNNVGGIFADRRVTEDGHEMTLQVNHLSGFLLTRLLRERLEASGAVVINTSSHAHLLGKLRLGDLQSERGYNPMRVYAASKLMNVLHAMEVQRRFAGVDAASFHPGAVATSFAREGRGPIRWIYETPLRRLFLISPERGADTLAWLVEGEPGRDWAPGGYFYKRKPGRKNPQVEPAAAAKLWEASERLLDRSPSS
jgi:NAD(P)-dependent dehydrogenase (short-subunit alcohol dehydrogenase family)